MMSSCSAGGGPPGAAAADQAQNKPLKVFLGFFSGHEWASMVTDESLLFNGDVSWSLPSLR